MLVRSITDAFAHCLQLCSLMLHFGLGAVGYGPEAEALAESLAVAIRPIMCRWHAFVSALCIHGQVGQALAGSLSVFGLPKGLYHAMAVPQKQQACLSNLSASAEACSRWCHKIMIRPACMSHLGTSLHNTAPLQPEPGLSGRGSVLCWMSVPLALLCQCAM
jgi:hypothetical protein